MKRIGIIRHIDSLGRLVIPKEMRDYLNISKSDKVEIIPLTGGVFLKKAESMPLDSHQETDNVYLTNL